jgi:hypothetical protein
MRVFSRRAAWIALAIGGVGALVGIVVTAHGNERSATSATPGKPPPPRWAALPPGASREPVLPLADRLRAQAPDSAFWRDDAPGADEARKGDEGRRWNALYGKVLSGTASQAEIDLYFEHLRRRSEDYLHVAEAALAEPGLSDRDRGLFTLAARMHRQRLSGLDEAREQAIARKQEQDQRRQAWRARAP